MHHFELSVMDKGHYNIKPCNPGLKPGVSNFSIRPKAINEKEEFIVNKTNPGFQPGGYGLM